MTKIKGFTLVELLIVVMLLAILAAIALPKFSNASANARASMLADNLRVIRTQITVFKSQHKGVAAGYPDCDTTSNPTEEAFIAHLTQSSNDAGETAAPGTDGYRYGPYLREVPDNPVNGKNTVQIITDAEQIPAAPDNSHGWIYQPATLTFKADSTGSDETGRLYFDY